MTQPRTLVVGATGQVGSQVAKILLNKGMPVRALVRSPEKRIHQATGDLEYAVGDLRDRESLKRALDGVERVVSSANSIIPDGKTLSVKAMNEDGYDALIDEAEKAGVTQFVQSSVPTWEREATVPELAGKRVLEDRLLRSPIKTTIVRNPAFTDVWLVMTGVLQAQSEDPHATTRRPYGFMKMWQGMVGNFAVGRGIMLAPGGPDHGAPLICTRDVAEMMAGSVGREETYDRIIEAGGPQWLTWREVAELVSQKAGRKVRPISMPGWFAATGQSMMRPIMPSAYNVLGLVKLVASHQPRWEAPSIVDELGLPPQITVAEYLDRNWSSLAA